VCELWSRGVYLIYLTPGVYVVSLRLLPYPLLVVIIHQNSYSQDYDRVVYLGGSYSYRVLEPKLSLSIVTFCEPTYASKPIQPVISLVFSIDFYFVLIL